MEPIILLHGGAGTISDDHKAAQLLATIKEITKKSYKKLTSDGTSVLDAVEYAVRLLEDNQLFNAGLGSVLTNEGEVEMDACIMQGFDLAAGAVTVVKDIKNPISLARLVMERTDHVLLAAEGAKKFAERNQVEILAPGALITAERREKLEQWRAEQATRHEMGTVGAVAIDGSGRLAAATSTGGREGKIAGRSSDTCMIGCGTYADDDVGAVSTTGHGETIAKWCLAHAIIKSMEKGESAHEAANLCIEKMTKRLNNTAGAIVLSKEGDVGVGFSTPRMSWAYQKGAEVHFGINQNQHEKEIIKD